MRRFVDRGFPRGSLESDAADLLRDAGPSRQEAGRDAEVKQRVRERLMEARVRPQRRLMLAPAIVVVSLGIGTAAAATMGVRWWQGAHEHERAYEDQSAARREQPRPTVVAPAPARVAQEPATAPAPQVREKRARPAGGVTEEGLLFEATRALRRDRDPVRAGAVLDDYFHRFPRGTLGEEALAVAIEAASERGDERARGLGRRYLARYPHGHFREVAERALARPAE